MKKPPIEEIRKMEQELLKPAEDRRSSDNSKISRDKSGKPIIKLEAVVTTVVCTHTEIEFNTLMRVYECAGWKWGSKDLPTKWRAVDVNYNTDVFFSIQDKFGQGLHFPKNYLILSTEQLYEQQDLTLQTVKEINKYFEERK